MFLLSDWEYEIMRINTLRALMDEGDILQEQMSNVSREMEILIKNQSEMPETESYATEKKKKMPVMNLLAESTWIRKEFLS